MGPFMHLQRHIQLPAPIHPFVSLPKPHFPFMMKSMAVSVAVVLSAVAVSAAPALVQEVTGPSSVVDIDGLVVKATLKNVGDEQLKLLNDPHTVLSGAPTNTFTITSELGSPHFTGIKMKYVPTVAAAVGKESDFTLLAPGGSIEVIHNLAGVYNFTQCGEGAYQFTPSNLFHYIDSSGELKTIEASSSSNRFKISGKLVTANAHTHRRELTRRAVSYSGCTPTEEQMVSDAVTNSITYVNDATAYMNAITTLPGPRYTTWFGAYDADRLSTVQSHFTNIGADALEMNYDCTTCRTTPPSPDQSYDTTYAYVFPDSPDKIYLCGAFWSSPAVGANSQAGTIVHELSHFTVNGGTLDNVYGLTDAMNLASTNPSAAIMNADNHEYFAENTPSLE